MIIFLLAASGWAVLTIAVTQQQARNSAFFFTMPMSTLSGFGTPISSMPKFFQKLSYLNPLRHVVTLLSSVYLKGSGLDVLWRELAPMAVFAALLLAISIFRFKKSVE